jgi:hypothetical protein
MDLDNFESRWMPHPQGDIDLCVMPIAPLVREAEAKGHPPFYINLDKSLIHSELVGRPLASLWRSLIRGPNVAQEDIELALALLSNEEDALEYVLGPVIDRAPHLLRGLHRFVGTMYEIDESLWEGIVSRLKSPRTLPEHDLSMWRIAGLILLP